MSTARWLIGDVFERMAELPDASVDLVVTSPPFLALRSYLPADHPDKGKEIGSEPTPAAFLATMMALTREWRRILAPHGSIAVELGDTYAGSGGAGGDYDNPQTRLGQPKFTGSAIADRKNKVLNENGQRMQQGAGWPLAKSLCGIPTLYPWSLAYGHNLLNPDDRIEPWRIRNLIAWVRPDPPVGALGDKVRPATSYITVACTSAKRWFDLDAERTEPVSHHVPGERSATASSPTRGVGGDNRGYYTQGNNPAGAPLLDWWNIPPGGYSGAHYAVYPPELPRRLINLMCPRQVCVTCGEPRRRLTETTQLDTGRTTNGAKPRDRAESFAGTTYATRTESSVETLGWSDCGHDTWRNGIVLDPFGGSGTTAMVASGLGRDSISIDLDPRNADLAYERVGMFLEVTP